MKIKEDICKYISEIKGSRSACVIGIGCKSGLHRSVSFAEKLREELRDYDACVVWQKSTHLDIHNGNSTEKFNRRSDDSFVCITCNNLKCNDAKQMNEHLRSKKHKKRLAKHSKSTKKRSYFHNDDVNKWEWKTLNSAKHVVVCVFKSESHIVLNCIDVKKLKLWLSTYYESHVLRTRLDC